MTNNLKSRNRNFFLFISAAGKTKINGGGMKCFKILVLFFMMYTLNLFSMGKLNLHIAQNDSLKFSDFIQYLPVLGGGPGEYTEVSVSNDEEVLSVTFKIYVADKSTSFASVMERDQDMGEDDYVQVIIDTYNNNTDALSFQTNMLGTKVDEEISENANIFNSSWNTLWEVKTLQTEYGWTAEFSIPFASLRFESSENVTMGFKFIRQIKVRNEIVVFPMRNTNIDKALYNLNYAQKISFGKISAKKRILVTPYITNNIVQQYNLNKQGTAYENNTEFIKGKSYFGSKSLDRILSNIGIDAKYKINSNNTLDLTLNTDYARRKRTTA